MRIKQLYILCVMAIAVVTTMGCSTQKNTRATRLYHQTKVKYNILHNGTIAYEEGLKQIRDANQDDYSRVLYLYPVSNHTAAQASTAQMDKTIEKCRKCIKLHSIKAKPKRDPKKAKDPKYKLWLQSKEFNANMHMAWIRLGEAEFHKGDFLGCISTMNYVIRLYENDADMIARCQLWIARAYAELGWQYEAEDMLNRVQIDALSKKHARFYSAVKADVLLHSGQYKAAIPFVKIAIPYEKRKIYRPRFAYVLGQLYELNGQRQEAIDAYKDVIRMTPPHEMDFNARVRIAELEGIQSLRQLRTMVKQAKYKDKLDQLYGTMGNIHLQNKDTAEALEMYQMAITEATQAGYAKAAILLQAGDIYYEQKNYVQAQPCYQEALNIITADHQRYTAVQQRSEVLDELIVAYTQVQLQDSLQRLSTMTEQQQREIVDKIIADLIEKEKADSAQQAQLERELERGDQDIRSVNTANMLGVGNGQKGEWYFYNPQLIKQGQQEWRRRWGTRTLEDNWRRQNKQVVAMFDDDDYGDDDPDQPTDSLAATNDSITKLDTPETDIHKPEYYLQQIPKTPQELALSDSLWRDAMVALVYIYRDKVEDDQLAMEAFAELEKRHAGHITMLELCYSYYLYALRYNDHESAAMWKDKITRYYPLSTQAQIVNQPGYFDKLQRMAQEQDSLYAHTYNAYMNGQYEQVRANKQYAEKEYPLTPLMPRFLFLNAVSVARTEGQEAFVVELRDLIDKHPTTEMGAMAKDMLAMIGQGMESQQGTTTNTLAQMRGEVEQNMTDSLTDTIQWSDDRNQPSVVLLRMATIEEQPLNDLLYEIALFNFSQFLIRDFDLQKVPMLGNGSALRVSGFQDMDEAEWWIGLLKKNAEMEPVLTNITIQAVAEVNLPLVK